MARTGRNFGRMFFVRTTTYTAQTGTVELDLPYQCAYCHHQDTARVQTSGRGTSVAVYGIGGNANNASHAAREQAVKNAHAAVREAACPACGSFAWEKVSKVNQARIADTRRGKRRVPLAAVPAALLFLLIAPFAAADRSGWLFLLAASSALGLFGLVFLLASPKRVAAVMQVPNNVWFHGFDWEGKARAPVVHEPTGIAPAPAPVRVPSWVGFVGAVACAPAAMLALAMWGATFKSARVVNANDEQLTVKVDGKEMGKIAARSIGEDVPTEKFSVRTGNHVIETFDSKGALVGRSTVSLSRGSSELLFAPKARAQGACVVMEEVRYGNARSARLNKGRSITRLNDESDTFEAPKGVYLDVLFREPPATIRAESGSSTTKHALRAYRCTKTDVSRKPFSARGLEADDDSESDDD